MASRSSTSAFKLAKQNESGKRGERRNAREERDADGDVVMELFDGGDGGVDGEITSLFPIPSIEILN